MKAGLILMIKISVLVDKARKALINFRTRFPGETIAVVNETAIRVQKRMNVEGTEISHPVQWDSEKQKNAFFATNGFDKGIPYQRTFGSSQAFQVQTFGGGVSLSAKHPAGAIFGMPTANWWQSRIHRGRWPWLKTELFAELDKLPSEIIRRLKIVFNGKGE